jgi:hypothetical protein
MNIDTFLGSRKPEYALLVYNETTRHYTSCIQKIADKYGIVLYTAKSKRLKIPMDDRYTNWDDCDVIMKVDVDTGYVFALKNNFKKVGSVFSTNFNKQIAIAKLRELQ